MDLVSVILMLCVGNTVGWLAGIYVQGGLLGILGDVIVATVGALAAGFVYRQFVPEAGAAGLLAAGLLAAALAVVLWRRFAPAAR